MTNPRHPTDIDKHIGIKIRQRRREIGQSQEALAAAIGVSYQQCQKVESGLNRVAASRLFDIAKAQGVPPSWYYEGLAVQPPAPADLERDRWLTGATAHRLVTAAMGLSPTILTALADFAATIAPKRGAA